MSWKAVHLQAVVIMLFSTSVIADDLESHSLQCIEQKIKSAPPSTTVAELKTQCAVDAASIENTKQEDSLILTRIQREQDEAKSRYSLLAHNRNYMLPVTYLENPNGAPYRDLVTTEGEVLGLDHIEAKFQISLKTMLVNNLFVERGAFYFAFTGTSYWQVYNKDVSSPFRETNYEPELFLTMPFTWAPLNIDATLLMLGFSHQSNGQSGSLSRSWNRLYARFIWEQGDFVFSFKPWYRIPESAKDSPSDPRGDDNPDIEDYMGHFEFAAGYRKDQQEITALFRNNLSSNNKGAIQIEWTFPLLQNVRGYIQYFNGYGENLIDYNVHTERIGVGFLLTDLL